MRDKAFNRRPRLAALALALLLLAGGCAAGHEEPLGQRVYCLDTTAEEGGRLVYTYMEPLTGASREARCAQVIEAVLDPVGEGRASALPQGTTITLTIQGAVVRAELDAAFDTLPDTDKTLAAAALTLSLLELGDVSYVYITAGGKSQPPFYDRPAGRTSFLTEEDAVRYF